MNLKILKQLLLDEIVPKKMKTAPLVVIILIATSCSGFGEEYTEKKIVPLPASNETDKSSTIYAFVGKKISLEMIRSTDTGLFATPDRKFKGKYLVVDNVYNSIESDTIEFIGFDHYGIPEFSEFEHVLLYLRKEDSLFYHLKYQYNDVYRASNGKWAGTYSNAHQHPYNRKENKLQPIRIVFKDSVSYNLRYMRLSDVNRRFNKKHFKIDYNKMVAVPLTGNYAEDLFRLNQNGFLKARGYFR